jgi:uncharacterized repeat protein (TIGR01451 family)
MSTSRQVLRTAARGGVAAALILSVLTLVAGPASADAPIPVTADATVVSNGDGTATLTLEGTWDWSQPSNQCNVGGRIVGWAVDWNDPDQTGYTVGANAYDVGVATAGRNPIDPQATSVYIDPGNDPCPANWGPITHVYEIADLQGGGITPCVVLYDVRTNAASGNHSRIAGGTNYNHDNSLDEPNSGPSVCAAVSIPDDPDVAVEKTGPHSATVGQEFTYDITATNTGIVDADDVTITDELPATVDFVSATAPCTYDAGNRTVTCNVGTLAPDETATVHITVVPTEVAPITNTAVVTPDDATPEDNTSTWEIVQVADEDLERPPEPPPSPVIQAAPSFTG